MQLERFVRRSNTIAFFTIENDGYNAIQISYGEVKQSKVNKATAGHFAKADVTPAAHLVELKVDNPDEYEVGQEITVTEVFEAGTRADVAR